MSEKNVILDLPEYKAFTTANEDRLKKTYEEIVAAGSKLSYEDFTIIVFVKAHMR